MNTNNECELLNESSINDTRISNDFDNYTDHKDNGPDN